MGWYTSFSYVAMRELVKFLQTKNLESQALAAKSSGADPDLKTTGLKPAWLNGVFIPSVAAQATIDLGSSSVAVDDLAGKVIAENDWRWVLVLQKPDGTTLVKDCGGAAAAVIPNFDATVYIAVGIAKLVATGAALTIGTTNLTTDSTVFVYQFTGPVFPDQTTMDKN